MEGLDFLVDQVVAGGNGNHNLGIAGAADKDLTVAERAGIVIPSVSPTSDADARAYLDGPDTPDKSASYPVDLINYAACYAIWASSDGMAPALAAFLLSGVIWILRSSLLGGDSQIFGVNLRDSLSKNTATAKGNEFKKALEDAKKKTSIDAAGSVIVAANISYVNCGDPLGGEDGKLSGYVKKVYDKMASVADVPAGKVYHTVRLLSKWASRRLILQSLGFNNVRNTLRYPINGKNVDGNCIVYLNNIYADDIALRVKAFPAGCTHVSAMYDALGKMFRHPILPYIPDITSLKVIVEEYNKILADPLSYHVHAKELTGRDRKVGGNKSVEACRGRTGSFTSVFSGKSTLAASTAFSKGGNKEEYKNAPDYDEKFHNKCIEIRMASVTALTSSDTKFYLNLSGSTVIGNKVPNLTAFGDLVTDSSRDSFKNAIEASKLSKEEKKKKKAKGREKRERKRSRGSDEDDSGSESSDPGEGRGTRKKAVKRRKKKGGDASQSAEEAAGASMADAPAGAGEEAVAAESMG